MKYIVILFASILLPQLANSRILYIGTAHTYANLTQAATDVLPGDSIIFQAGIYPGGEYIFGLQGTEFAYIYILPEQGAEVIIRGGTNSWQLSNAAYLHIEGFIFENQTGNGFNMDDGGDYNTPAHHVIFSHCTFRDIDASGNNDLLKLSGLDDFKIMYCNFLNGAEGGSGIDMVGCHRGEIIHNTFQNMGSNAIQAKGGTAQLTINKNFFRDCGQRTLNLGGNTGLEYFRPLDATYEAAEISAGANIIIGSLAPVAFVGCMRSEFINNTIIFPEKWALRILQESVNPERFEACGNNIFRDNIIYKNNAASTDCNIGPNTAAETFTISNNLWYNVDNPSNSNPVGLPVTDQNSLTGQDPLMNNVAQNDFAIPANSPAVAAGYPGGAPESDYIDRNYANPPSIGAFEGNHNAANYASPSDTFECDIFPNPTQDQVQICWSDKNVLFVHLEVMDLNGKVVSSGKIANNYLWVNPELAKGIYFFRLLNDGIILIIRSMVFLH